MRFVMLFVILFVILIALWAVGRGQPGGGDAGPVQVNVDRLRPMTGPVEPTELNKGDYDPRLIDIHQEIHRTFATKYELWVGPLKYSYSTKGNNISISGTGHVNIMYHHSSNMDEGHIRSRSMHEYMHLVQKAYGAVSKYTTEGDVHENWRHSGPRWWTEGSAEWITLVYCKLNNIPIDSELESSIENAKEHYRYGRQRCVKGGKQITIREIITPNLTENPEWRYVKECDIYESHVYKGGLLAVDFLLKHKRGERELISIINMIKDVRTHDDWEKAFLDWSKYSSMSSFYSDFEKSIRMQEIGLEPT